MSEQRPRDRLENIKLGVSYSALARDCNGTREIDCSPCCVLLQLLRVENGHGGDVVGGLLEGTCLAMLLPEGSTEVVLAWKPG